MPSPDGKRAAFIRDWNLWVRDVATGKETQLTTDGVKDFGYATDNAGWTTSERPILVWSPDSKKVATFQQDQRNVGEMYLVRHRGRPSEARRRGSIRCRATTDVAMIQRVVIDVDAGEGVALQDGARSAPLDALRRRRLPRGEWADVQWSPDGRQAGVRLHVARPQARASCAWRTRRPATIREVMEETVATFFESGNGARQLALPAGVERGASGSPSATTGGTSISTICRPGS